MQEPRGFPRAAPREESGGQAPERRREPVLFLLHSDHKLLPSGSAEPLRVQIEVTPSLPLAVTPQRGTEKSEPAPPPQPQSGQLRV